MKGFFSFFGPSSLDGMLKMLLGAIVDSQQSAKPLDCSEHGRVGGNAGGWECRGNVSTSRTGTSLLKLELCVHVSVCIIMCESLSAQLHCSRERSQ